MNKLMVLTKKELTQIAREYKFVWLPLVFILLGLTQPLMSYFLPEILDALGGVEGITIDPGLMAQTGNDVLASSLDGQFNQLGLIVIVVSLMMMIKSDKDNGMLAFMLTKPVSIRSYILSKIVTHYMLIAVSVMLGYIVSYIYVNFYFPSVSFGMMSVTLVMYLIWILFIVTFMTMMSTIFNNQVIIAILSVGLLLAANLISGLHPIISIFSPASMSHQAIGLLITETVQPYLLWSILLNIIWIGAMVWVTDYWIKQRKFSQTNQ